MSDLFNGVLIIVCAIIGLAVLYKTRSYASAFKREQAREVIAAYKAAHYRSIKAKGCPACQADTRGGTFCPRCGRRQDGDAVFRAAAGSLAVVKKHGLPLHIPELTSGVVPPPQPGNPKTKGVNPTIQILNQ